MRFRRSCRLLFIAVGMLGCGLTTMTAMRPLWAATVTQKIVINGGGEPGIDAELVSWQNALYASSGSVEFNYAKAGSQEGRRLLLTGQKSFAISSVPFTDAELASRPAGSAPYISAPFSVQSLSIFMELLPTNYQIDTPIPNCDPNVDLCDVWTPFTGVLRVPPETLLSLAVGGYPRSSSSQWDDPTWQAQLHAPTLRSALNHQFLSFINFTEGSSSNKYVLDYVKAMAPSTWSNLVLVNPAFTSAGERLPKGPLNIYGYAAVLGMLNAEQDPSGYNGPLWGGNAAALSTDSAKKFVEDHPNGRYPHVFPTAEIANKHGDYLLPTAAAVQAALDAGGETPDYAATHDVPGAYPMVSVNRLYAPSTGLSMDETNALAALIRYVATDGQQDVVQNGGVALTASMRAEALSAADRLVSTNCTNAGERVTAGGPGPNEPSTPGIVAIGTMKHCDVVPPPETTTVADTTTTEPATTTVPDTTTTVPDTTLADTTTTPRTSTPRTATRTTKPRTTTTKTRPAATTATTLASTTIGDNTSTVSADVQPPSDLPSAPPDSAPQPLKQDSAVAGSAPSGITGTEAPAANAAAVTIPANYSTTLPMQPPDDGRGGFKKLGTFILGAVGFLVARARYLRHFSGQ